MQSVNTLKIDAVAGFASSVYMSAESGEMAAERGVSREAMALSVADGTQTRGILPLAMRARLDRMTKDYAEILKRLDDLRMIVEGEILPERVPVRVC